MTELIEAVKSRPWTFFEISGTDDEIMFDEDIGIFCVGSGRDWEFYEEDEVLGVIDRLRDIMSS